MEQKRIGLPYVFTLAKEERGKLGLGMLLAVLSSALSLVPYMVVYQILLLIIKNEVTLHTILKWAGIGIGAAVLQAIFTALAGICSHTAAFNTMHRIKVRVLEHMSKFNLGYFQEHAPGQIKTTLFDDVDRIENFLAHSTLELAQAIVVPLMMFLFMLRLNWKMALIMLIPMILGIAIPMALMGRYPDLTDEFAGDTEKLNASANEFITVMPVIKMYHLTAEKFEQYRTALKVYTEDINLFLDEQFVSAQMLITSEDGYHFDNIKDKKTIIPVFNNSEIGDARHTRDPKVWKEDDGWYMVLGSTINNKQGKLLFFKSTDKKNWTYMNFVTKDNGFGWMWECPDYFQTDGEQILIFSPMDFNKGGKSYSDQSICMKVMFQKETCHMEMPDTYQYLDYGLDLYAPQTTVDEAGRRVLLAWLRMPKPVDGQWSGMQCIPRVIEVKNDHIYFRVHPNIRNAFSKKINSPDEADENGYRVSFSLEDGETVDIGGYQITRKGNKIHTDRGRLVDTSWEMQTEFSTPDLKDGFQIDVYVDPNLIEVFVNDGEYIISNCVYNLGTDIHQQGNVKYEMYTLEGTEVSEV